MLKIVSRLLGQELNPDMILTVGDNDYITGSAAYGAVSAINRFFPTLGNLIRKLRQKDAN